MKFMNILIMVIILKKNVIDIRRDLHQIPELDKNLPQTLAYISEFLKDLNCEIRRPAAATICAYFHFHKDHTIAYRSDMDALPIQESNNHDYSSKHDGKMHACGHDGHMAMLLDFARYVSSLAECDYNVLLIFQPAEETSGGAKEICDSGLLKEVCTVAVFGIHLWPTLKTGCITSRAGYLMARSSEVHFHVYGKTAHIAEYKKGIDAMNCACILLQEIYKKYPSSNEYVLKFGFHQSGTAGNCVSSYSLLKGTLRTYDEQLHNKILKDIHHIINALEKDSHCHILTYVSEGYPALRNNDNLFHIIQQSLEIETLAHGNFLTDDFSFYALQYPSIYFYLGTGNEIPLHSDHFDFEEKTLTYGVVLYKELLTLDYRKIFHL